MLSAFFNSPPQQLRPSGRVSMLSLIIDTPLAELQVDWGQSYPTSVAATGQSTTRTIPGLKSPGISSSSAMLSPSGL